MRTRVSGSCCKTCVLPRFVTRKNFTALSNLLFNTAKNGRDVEDLFRACALSSPVTFLTDHVYKSDLTRPCLAFGFVSKSSGYEIGLVLSFTFLVSPCSRLVFSCLEFCLFLSCLVISFRLAVFCPVLSCLVLACSVLSCPVLSCPVLSCLISSRLVSSCLVLSLQTFLRDASQPEMHFLHSWAVVLHKFFGGGGGGRESSLKA